MAGAFASPLLVGMHHYFGIGIRLEAMSQGFQSGAQFAEIINFSVEDYRKGSRLIPDRLVAARKIDDAEAAHSQGDGRGDENSFGVRATMMHGREHAPGQGFDRRSFIFSVFGRDNAADAAHEIVSP